MPNFRVDDLGAYLSFKLEKGIRPPFDIDALPVDEEKRLVEGLAREETFDLAEIVYEEGGGGVKDVYQDELIRIVLTEIGTGTRARDTLTIYKRRILSEANGFATYVEYEEVAKEISSSSLIGDQDFASNEMEFRVITRELLLGDEAYEDRSRMEEYRYDGRYIGK